MGKTVNVVCDRCNRDITTTSNCVDYMIVLGVENIPSRGGSVTLMNIVPPLDRSYYFCSLACFVKWTNGHGINNQ